MVTDSAHSLLKNVLATDLEKVPGGNMMSHYAALYSIIFMISFVGVFDLRHRRRRLCRLIDSITLMTSDELERIRKIQAACLEA